MGDTYDFMPRSYHAQTERLDLQDGHTSDTSYYSIRTYHVKFVNRDFWKVFCLTGGFISGIFVVESAFIEGKGRFLKNLQVAKFLLALHYFFVEVFVTCGLGFALALCVAKIVGLVDWSWLWVLSPLWICILPLLVVGGFVLLAVFIMTLGGDAIIIFRERKKCKGL